MSLEQYIISLFEADKTKSPEFERLLAVYGRPKLVGIWQKYQADKKAVQAGQTDPKIKAET
jgi:hypothetical protein